MKIFVEKGMRVRAQVMSVNPNTCLAGMQMKVGMSVREFVGVIRHVRTDSLDNPTRWWVYLETPAGASCAKCGVNETEVNANNILEIL